MQLQFAERRRRWGHSKFCSSPYLINLIPDILECLSEKNLSDETQNLINLRL
jgi:hypothetical protein